MKEQKNNSGLPTKVRYCSECNLSNQQPTGTNEHFHTSKTVQNTIEFDDNGAIRSIDAPLELLDRVTNQGVAFMTDGCPDRQGEMACNRPYGSYRPGEEFRDYPFLPEASDLEVIRGEMKLDEVTKTEASAVA